MLQSTEECEDSEDTFVIHLPGDELTCQNLIHVNWSPLE